MVITTCNGCGQRIAEDDRYAARRVQLGPDELVDWCGPCVAVVRAELPRLVAQAREARRAAAAEPVQRRALSIWRSGEQISVKP